MRLSFTPFAGEKALAFDPGQYVKVMMSNGISIPCYIANSPREDGLCTVYIERTDDEVFDLFEWNIQRKRELWISGPLGECSLKLILENKAPLIIIAEDIRVTAAKALLEKILLEHRNQFVHLFWGVKDFESALMHDLFHAWQQRTAKLRYTLVLDKPCEPYVSGVPHQAFIKEYPDLRGHQILICARDATAVSAQSICLQHGAHPDRVLSDKLRRAERQKERMVALIKADEEACEV